MSFERPRKKRRVANPSKIAEIKSIDSADFCKSVKPSNFTFIVSCATFNFPVSVARLSWSAPCIAQEGTALVPSRVHSMRFSLSSTIEVYVSVEGLLGPMGKGREWEIAGPHCTGGC